MVTQKQIAQYREQGYVLISGLFSPRELDELEAEFESILERRVKAGAKLDATWAGNWRKAIGQKTEILHTHDVQGYSAAWTRALVSNKFTAAMAALLGTDNVQLHHTKLFLKPPEKGSPFPMHQDYPYFPHARNSMMAGIIHLSDATVKMGCLRVVPGSHKLGALECHEMNHLDPKDYPVDAATPVPAKRGDVAFFNYLTIHGSGINESKRARKTVLVQVRDAADWPLDSQHPSMAQGMMLRGINPLTAGSAAEGSHDKKVAQISVAGSSKKTKTNPKP